MTKEECEIETSKAIMEMRKRIAELEKELEQAKKVQVVEHFEAYGQCQDSRRIASLEKENAELRVNLKWEQDTKSELAELLGKANDENAELEQQIEKMKCCEMCKHKNLNWGFSPICEARDNIKIENPLTCKCDKWEIKEND